ncbi:hypothetical protein PanWU01x14_009560 [Parasponia andersonii]|uniref:Reverse transcriptase domain-containing protein n=1 Tax=Parasponia andersonii TaxID=3476 RepID=A0A2P5E2G3_PARAD|nr:hypothetical protein PanWU01x14_009560 [Parasponia andersonii]
MGERIELLVHLGVCAKVIHCAEVLSRILLDANKGCDLKGIKVSRTSPEITHLLFADDLIHFGRATKKVAKSMAACLEKNLPLIGAERYKHKIASWKSRVVSKADRLTLISSVGQAMPIYGMSSTKLPQSICKGVDELLRKFWWDTNASGNPRLHL